MVFKFEELIKMAANHIASADPVLSPIISRYGICTIRPHTNYYRELVESIISQQLSVKAAASINRKFIDLFDAEFPSPSAILEKSHEELRSAGLSNAKAKYITDLAQHVLDGRLKFDKFDSLSNQDIINELTTVKGIGEWTAHM
ncbi:MAG: DNA-3-methyladenine glycosylase 2 family protein, partial [bacterium]|nr:DNA-3-methyladenine glycosylase 2 family protein [bacterium]